MQPLNSERLPFGGISTTITHGSVKFTAACFGKPEDWSISPFQQPGDTMKDPIVAEQIGYALQSLKARRVYATSPVYANARVIDPYRLDRYIRLPYNVMLIRNRDIPADGTRLYPGDASAMSAGGCPRIVVACGERMACGHAGRDSLIDRTRVLTGKPGRKRESVVESLLHAVAYDRSHKDVFVWVFFSIHWERFLHEVHHPVHGAYNRSLPMYVMQHWGAVARASIETTDTEVKLDLPRLIQAQFCSCGVPVEQVRVCEKYSYGSPDLLFDTRGPEANKRNLVAIVRHT